MKKFKCTLFSVWHRPEIHDGFDTEEEAVAFGKKAKDEMQFGYEVEEYNEKG